jgi:hypothetical protein
MSSGVKVYFELIRFDRTFLLSSFSCGGAVCRRCRCGREAERRGEKVEKQQEDNLYDAHFSKQVLQSAFKGSTRASEEAM